jgi:hypothetical protein
LPAWEAIDPRELEGISDNLTFFDIVGSGEAVRFLIRYRGARIEEAFGPRGQAKHLEEVLPAGYRDPAMNTYRQVLMSRRPVYTVGDTRDRNGRIVHLERLLLPFSREGRGVDRVLASLEMVSPEGAFENRDIFKDAAWLPSFALCATIHH